MIYKCASCDKKFETFTNQRECEKCQIKYLNIAFRKGLLLKNN